MNKWERLRKYNLQFKKKIKYRKKLHHKNKKNNLKLKLVQLLKNTSIKI